MRCWLVLWTVWYSLLAFGETDAFEVDFATVEFVGSGTWYDTHGGSGKLDINYRIEYDDTLWLQRFQLNVKSDKDGNLINNMHARWDISSHWPNPKVEGKNGSINTSSCVSEPMDVPDYRSKDIIRCIIPLRGGTATIIKFLYSDSIGITRIAGYIQKYDRYIVWDVPMHYERGEW